MCSRQKKKRTRFHFEDTALVRSIFTTNRVRLVPTVILSLARDNSFKKEGFVCARMKILRDWCMLYNNSLTSFFVDFELTYRISVTILYITNIHSVDTTLESQSIKRLY